MFSCELNSSLSYQASLVLQFPLASGYMQLAMEAGLVDNVMDHIACLHVYSHATRAAAELRPASPTVMFLDCDSTPNLLREPVPEVKPQGSGTKG